MTYSKDFKEWGGESDGMSSLNFPSYKSTVEMTLLRQVYNIVLEQYHIHHLYTFYGCTLT